MLNCAFDFNGGIESSCELEIHRTNDSAMVWSGQSDQSSGLDSCVFTLLQLLSLVSYKFTVTTVNTMGKAEPYSFFSSVVDSPLSRLQTEHTNRTTTTGHGRKLYWPDSLLEINPFCTVPILDLLRDGNWIFLLVLFVLLIFLLILIYTILSIGKLYSEHEAKIEAARQYNQVHRVVGNMQNEVDIDNHDIGFVDIADPYSKQPACPLHHTYIGTDL